MENIGGIKDILDSINNGVVKDTKDAYLQLDEELGERIHRRLKENKI